MRFDQQDALVICICPGLNGRWDVAEKGFDHPMASFDEKEDAYAYAACVSRTRRDSTVLVEDEEGFSPMPPQGDAGLSRTAAGRIAHDEPPRGTHAPQQEEANGRVARRGLSIVERRVGRGSGL